MMRSKWPLQARYVPVLGRWGLVEKEDGKQVINVVGGRGRK